jgi:hypothetical protein
LFHVLIHFLSFLLKITIQFTTNKAVKIGIFSQKLPGSAAVLLCLYPHRGFAPPFTILAVSEVLAGDAAVPDGLVSMRRLNSIVISS